VVRDRRSGEALSTTDSANNANDDGPSQSNSVLVAAWTDATVLTRNLGILAEERGIFDGVTGAVQGVTGAIQGAAAATADTVGGGVPG
jgi:hypothetical protein